MEFLVWIGSALSLAGVAALIWCIVLVLGARRAKLSDDQMRARLKSLLPLNLGAVLLSALGLMLVVVGLMLK